MKTLYRKARVHLVLVATALLVVACGSNESGSSDEVPSFMEKQQEKKTYGIIKSVDVGPGIDAKMAAAGHEVFDLKCTACHKMDERYVGPALGDVTNRRPPEYIMNMTLDTETMLANDDTAKCLLQEFLITMPNQSVDEKDARAVLEYLRDYASKSK